MNTEKTITKPPGTSPLRRLASCFKSITTPRSGHLNPKQLLTALGTATLLCGAATVGHAQILVFQAPASGGANATSQDPSSIAANIAVDGLQRIQEGTVGGNVLYKTATTVWTSEPHWASPGGSNSYQGTRSDTGYVFTVTAATGFTFDLTEVTFRHRATSAGPGTVGIKIGSTEFGGTGTSVSTSVGTYNSGALGLTGLTSATFIVQGWGSGGTGNGEFQMNNLQVFGSVNADGPPPANNNSVLSIPATSAFGRVMSGSSQTVSVSNVGDATTFSASATGGFSPSATGSVTEDGSSNLSVGVGSTLGSRSGTLTVNNTAPDSNGPGEGSDQAPITSALSATVVQNRVLNPGAVAGTDEGGIDLGRQMLGTVTGTHTVTSTGADAENTRLTFSETANNTFGGYAGSGLAEVRATNADGQDVVLNGSNSMNIAYEFDFTQTGARANDSQYILFNTGNGISGEGLTGESVLSGQPNSGQLRVYIQNATIVDNREIETTQVDLGSVLVGTTTGAETTTLTTSGDDDHRTRVTVQSDSVSSNGVTVASAATATLFDSADAETTRSVSGNFATSGSKDIDVNLVVTGEGLTGEAVNPVVVNAIAEVYQAASLTANNTTDVASGGNVQLSNAATNDGGQRAAAQIVSRELTGATAWSVSGLAVDTDINADASASGTATLDTAGLLAGTHMAIFTLGAQHADQGIIGTSANDLGTFSWTLSQEVVSTGGGSATVLPGQPYSEFNTVRDGGADTSLNFLGGVASTERELVIGFADAPAGNFFSDVVTITGLTGDRFVLSVSYDADLLDGFPVEQLFLGWDDGASFINAVLGNVGENDVNLASPYVGTWQDYQDETSRTIATALGAYGVDGLSTTVWAVLDHNSAFSVIPEPSTYAIFIGMLAFALILLRRRARS